MCDKQFKVSTRSRPKAADTFGDVLSKEAKVSTRSRPKAADTAKVIADTIHNGFNTQPPEGG